MATSVNSAFKEFNSNIVNIDSDRNKKANSSRDWLITQLKSLPNKIDDFPDLYEGKSIKFGSFARKTKIASLDDIDIILTFSANRSTYWTYSYGKEYSLTAPETATKLRKLCNDDNTINSKKLINKLISSLNEIEQYKSAELHRRSESATLQLNSYEWNFDIVPAFYTDKDYYLIPDGNGNWKATDPRIDQEKSSNINKKHKGEILQLIRTLKYWQRYAKMPTMSSYLFENIILNYFESKDSISDYIDVNLINFWLHLKTAIYQSVPDPKGFQDNLNTLSFDEKSKIASKSENAYDIGKEAYEIETKEKNQEKSINKWRQIFGSEFPNYS